MKITLRVHVFMERSFAGSSTVTLFLMNHQEKSTIAIFKDSFVDMNSLRYLEKKEHHKVPVDRFSM